MINTFVLEQSEGSRYAVSAPSASSPDAGAWAPDPAIERLNALAKTLVDPATLVGADGLANPAWETYKPTKMAVFISISEAPSQADPTPYFEQDGTMVVPLDGRYKYPEIGWPFEGTPDTFGTAFKGRYNMARCAFLTSADAMAAIASLPDVVASDVAPGYLASGSDWPGGSGIWHDKVVSLTVVGLLPEDVAGSCADALSY